MDGGIKDMHTSISIEHHPVCSCEDGKRIEGWMDGGRAERAGPTRTCTVHVMTMKELEGA